MWHASPLTSIVYGSTPILLVAAVDPANADLIYVISVGAQMPGDKLYRSTDGGDTLTEVFASGNPIKDVVIRDAQTVFVTTMMQSGMTFIGGPAFKSTNAGMAFDPMPTAPQLACLGTAPGGDMLGCGANWQPDYEAVARSTDAATSFAKVWRFVELAGPLKCPPGTAEYDMCDQAMWDSTKQQFGATGPTCGPFASDAPGDPVPVKKGGCCDAGDGAAGSVVLGIGLALLLGRRRQSAARQLG
jgi:hypothetical protein